MRVLVTGAGGFVGRSVSSKLEQEGHEVVRVVRSGSNLEASDRNTLNLDLCGPNILVRSVKNKPDIVVHLAAAIPSSFSGDDATRAAKINRRIDENVFRACRDLGIGAVYASGASVYGPGNGQIVDESAPTSPIGPYVAAKLAGEQAGERLLCQEGLHLTILRISAPYGPAQRAKTVLRLFIERALGGLPLLFHGTGSRQQDFTYVGDVADAISKACRVGRSGVYNISGGNPIAMEQLATLVVKCVPGCMSYVGPSGKADPQEGATTAYSITKARDVLGWRPQVSLEDGIKSWVANWTN